MKDEAYIYCCKKTKLTFLKKEKALTCAGILYNSFRSLERKMNNLQEEQTKDDKQLQK